MNNIFQQGACVNNSSTASTTGASPVDLVSQFTTSGNHAVVSSRVVADRFEIKHGDLMQKVINTKLSDPEVGAKLRPLIFESSYKDAQNKERPEYLLTRDGFSFIVMGLTGRKADLWKLRFIDAFNAMEQKLKEQHTQPSYQIPQTFAEALQLAADIQKENEKLLSENSMQAHKIKEDAPKVAAYDVFIGVSDDLISIGDFAKILHTKWNDIKPHRLFAILREAKILKDSYFDKNIPYQKYIDKGYFKVKESTSTNSLGYRFISKQALITPKGQKYLLDKFLAARESDPEEQMVLFESEE